MESPMYADVLADTGIDPEQVMARERETHEDMLAPHLAKVEEILATVIEHEDEVAEEDTPLEDLDIAVPDEASGATSGWRS